MSAPLPFFRLLFGLLLLGFWGNHPLAQNPDKILVVAHRGASKFAPENTLASCEKAIEFGADYIEMDIRQTKDGKYVLMHDKSVKRTTDGTEKIAEMMWADVQKLDAGSWFGEEFKGEKVPLFRDVLRAIKGRCLPDIDFKAGDPAGLIDILEEEGFLADGRVTFHSGNPDYLQIVLEKTDKVMIRPSVPKKEAEKVAFLQRFDPPIVNINWWKFSKKWVNEVHNQGKLAFVNTLWFDKKRNMRKAIAAGADFIQSDKLPVLIPLLEAAGKR